jgi:hypothetical protein
MLPVTEQAIGQPKPSNPRLSERSGMKTHVIELPQGSTEGVATRSHGFPPDRGVNIEPLHDRRKSTVNGAALV